jgi:hypothetical protein
VGRAAVAREAVAQVVVAMEAAVLAAEATAVGAAEMGAARAAAATGLMTVVVAVEVKEAASARANRASLKRLQGGVRGKLMLYTAPARAC